MAAVDVTVVFVDRLARVPVRIECPVPEARHRLRRFPDLAVFAHARGVEQIDQQYIRGVRGDAEPEVPVRQTGLDQKPAPVRQPGSNIPAAVPDHFERVIPKGRL